MTVAVGERVGIFSRRQGRQIFVRKQTERSTQLQQGPKIGSLESPRDIAEAVEFIGAKMAVAFQCPTVFGIAINGENPRAVEAVLSIKEDEPNRKFSGVLQTRRFLSYVDRAKVHPQLRALIDDPDRYDNTIATICHIRAPITREGAQAVPPSMVSYEGDTPYMHNLTVVGLSLQRLVDALEQRGITHGAVTTLNRHKREPEITNLQRALEFCQEEPRKGKLPLLLTDQMSRRSDVQGSFPIVDITDRGDGKLTGMRHGHYPFPVVERIVGVKIDVSKALPASYPQADFGPLLERNLDGVTPEQLRELAIAFISQT